MIHWTTLSLSRMLLTPTLLMNASNANATLETTLCECACLPFVLSHTFICASRFGVIVINIRFWFGLVWFVCLVYNASRPN